MKKILSLAFLALAFGLGDSAFAQNVASTGDCFEIGGKRWKWIDHNGKTVPGSQLFPLGAKLGNDPGTAVNPHRGISYERGPDGSWTDQNGQTVPGSQLFPLGAHLGNDPGTAVNPHRGTSYERVPCPPPDAAQQAGHTIKKILEHVSIGVGGELGGDDRRFHHDDRHVTHDKHSTDHKAHTTDQHTSDRKPSDAQKNATTSADKNRAHDHKKPTLTPTPQH